MKRFYLSVLIIVLLKSDLVKTLPPDNLGGGGKQCDCKGPTIVVYGLVVIIILLCLLVIGLLCVVYHLRKKTQYDEEDKIEITNTISTRKYTRELSSDTSEITFTRENSKEDGKFKLTREDSKLSVLDYSNNQDMSRIKREGPQTSTTTLNKIIPKQLHKDHLHEEQIKAICEAVKNNSRKRTEYTSLTNLDKIVSEAKAKGAADAIEDKSASSGLLDVIDSPEVSPCPLSVKQVINNFEVLPSPIASRKYIKPVDNKPQPIKKIDGTADGASSLPFRLPLLETNKIDSKLVDTKLVDTKLIDTKMDNTKMSITEDDIKDNSPRSNRTVSLVESEDEHTDDIYVDSPNNRPVSFDKDDGEHEDDVYDNPPNNRPVVNQMDDIYDDPTNNRPAFSTVDKDEIYGNANIEKFNQKDVYDFPPPLSRGIAISEDKSGYSTTLTTSKEPCFDTSYVNAKSFHC